MSKGFTDLATATLRPRQLPDLLHAVMAVVLIDRHGVLPSSVLAGRSKKAINNRLRHHWLRMGSEGDLCEVTMGRAAIMHRLGVQVLTRPGFSMATLYPLWPY